MCFNAREEDGKKWINWRHKHEQVKEKLALVWQLETENKISAEEELASLADWYSLLIHFMTFTWQSFEGGTQQGSIFSQNKKQKNAMWCSRWLTPTAISAIYDQAHNICCYIRNIVGFQAAPFVMADGIGSHWPLCAHCYINYIRLKWTTDKSYV